MTHRAFGTRTGPLAFPVTPFYDGFELDLRAFAAHLDWCIGFEPPALFVACGTGEFASLGPGEVGALAKLAVELARPKIPVYIGAGQSLSAAMEQARVAEACGATGLLLFPPYAKDFEPTGLAAYYQSIAISTSLDVILYQRDGVVLGPEVLDRIVDIANIVGIKDGNGEIERIRWLSNRYAHRFTFFNGMPTAETYQPGYQAMGVSYYSSAVFNFVPEISWAFWRALATGDAALVRDLVDSFFLPFVTLRRRARGYPVSLIKAGVAIRRGANWPVRPPLIPTDQGTLRELSELIEHGLSFIGSRQHWRPPENN